MTGYDSFKFHVMHFGLTNGLATFCALMNQVFYPFLDRSVIVYLDDVVAYSKNFGQTCPAVAPSFLVLRENEFYVKNCKFAKPKVTFLKHMVGDNMLRINTTKIQVIQKSKTPRLQTTKFPSLCELLEQVHSRLLSIASLLIALLKKNITWEWYMNYQRTFKSLKQTVMEKPVSTLSDHSKAYEMHTDAFDFAISGALM